ncbi:acyl-CoA thioesterase [Pseudenhygromyxa sp. WMMC2535]|uniref:acyl-CoA thioesterase n=1 Tax=Pseudenhygromyxa sp. WMMC2535 TaxID=2712867 RepID=UPI001557654F|nr:acyl-CoA thioesterase [Pseudenhygromyxa sp. WMMC2535]NVB39862.1 acyl-CoA thioesterase [Pseudenhygromyxa sp. WMMC2535]
MTNPSDPSSATPATPAAPHVHHLDIGFGDCDPAGIVYFPRYFDFFHQAMESWFPAALGMGYAEFVRGRKLGFPAVHSEADFVAPSRFGDRVAIHLRVAKLGRSSITLDYEVRGPVEGELRVKGRTVCVVMDLDERSPGHERAVPVPEDLRGRIEAFGVG